MPVVYKVLGQSCPAANTDTNIYTVPAATNAIVSTLAVCNLNTSVPATYRVAVRPGGAALANQHYISYEFNAPAADGPRETIGMTLNAGDVVTVRSSSGTVSFNLFGSEIS
mgnify:CR=1 FL=1